MNDAALGAIQVHGQAMFLFSAAGQHERRPEIRVGISFFYMQLGLSERFVFVHFFEVGIKTHHQIACGLIVNLP
jgi:hypothetical protein